MTQATSIADLLIRENRQEAGDLISAMPRTAGNIRRTKGMSGLEAFAGDEAQMQLLVDALRKYPLEIRETDGNYGALMTLLALSHHACTLSYLSDLIGFYIRRHYAAELLVWCELLHGLDHCAHLNTVYNQVAGFFYRTRRNVRTGSKRSIKEVELQTVERYMPEILPRTFYDTVIRHSQNTWDPRQLAERCGYSYHTFRKLFGSQFGCTVLQWMQQQRMELIRYLLAETDLGFEEITERCGFSGHNYLWDFCRRYFHDTPKNLRERWKAEKTGMIVPMG